MVISDAVLKVVHNRHHGGNYDIPSIIETADLGDAYDFQSAVVSQMLKLGHVSGVAGYKMAVNGKPQMEFFGVEEPCSGHIFAEQVVQSPATLDSSHFETLAVEAEIVAVIGNGISRLDNQPSRRQVAQAIDHFIPAIELIDMRGSKLTDSTLPKVVALNVFNAGCVLGEGSVAADYLNLENMTVSLHLNDELVAQKINNAPQHPLDAVAWLVGHLKRRSLELEPGMIVLCGTHVPLWLVDEKITSVGIEMSGLGVASLNLKR